jgi:hypothetical protein
MTSTASWLGGSTGHASGPVASEHRPYAQASGNATGPASGQASGHASGQSTGAASAQDTGGVPLPRQWFTSSDVPMRIRDNLTLAIMSQSDSLELIHQYLGPFEEKTIGLKDTMAKIRDWQEVPDPVKEMFQRNIAILNRPACSNAHLFLSHTLAMCL